MLNYKPSLTLVGVGIFLISLVAAVCAEAQTDLMADHKSNIMPISWDQAYFTIIAHLDESALENGQIPFDMKKLEGGTVLAQSIGLIEARPEECLEVVRSYNNYKTIMPYTVESKVIRSFKLEGEYAGAEAVDFWTKVSVFGFQTRYLIRVAQLADPERRLYRTFWTLVRNPAGVSGCRDSSARPCENDLEMNIGSHRFEPFKGNRERTVHTYSLRIRGKSWVQCFGMQVGCGNSMREVTESIREAVRRKR
jgi:hypothetical protein